MNPVDIEGSRLENEYKFDAPKPRLHLTLQPKCRFDDKEVKINIRRSSKYPSVEWGVLSHPPCALVGGGPGLSSCLHILRDWKGDIFAINDTAGFLSDQGIESTIFSIDATDVPFKIGPLVKGAVFATRVHRRQFQQMKGKPINTFFMAEDNTIRGGVEGGPTAVCRSPHLFLRMGYAAIYYFGIESCFYNVTHVGGTRDDAFWNMMVIEVGGKQYLTNGGFLLQAQWMADYFKKYPKFLINCSGGFMKAIEDDRDGWSVIAITGDLKQQYEAGGNKMFSREHTIEEDKLWRPPLVFERQSMEAR